MQHDDDEPLDPTLERLRRKLTRLLLVSGGIMLIGFLAVLVAVIYRVSKAAEDDAATAEPAAPAAVAATAELPVRSADLVAATVGDGHLVLTIGGETPRIEVRRLPDGALVTTFTLAPDAAAD